MTVNYSDFMHFADNLSESEIGLRNAASRSYYAAYHRCLLVFHPNLIGNDRSGGSHKQLSSSLINSNDSGDRKIGYKLKQAHQIRCKADYILADDFDKIDKKQALNMAQDIIQIVDELFPDLRPALR